MTKLMTLALLVLFNVGCAERERCSQSKVDECFSAVGCEGVEACRVTTAEMNHLCECLEAFGCDQPWYHHYCNNAPYATDGGCPICGE